MGKRKMSDSILAGANQTLDKSAVINDLRSHFSKKREFCDILSALYFRIADNEEIANKFAISGEKRQKLIRKSKAVENCGTYLEFSINETDNSDVRLSKAYFCKDRLCPMCNWRKSLKVFAQISKIMDAMEKENEYAFIFLTLTIKNCSGSDLKDTLEILRKGYSKLLRKKECASAFQGSFATWEVTYNRNTNEWHPHIHAIIAVKKYYFSGKYYISQERFRELWSECIKTDYLPLVNVKKVKSDENLGISIKSAVCEVAKYAVKGSDVVMMDDLDQSTKNVIVLLDALNKKRLITMTGCFKELHKKLNLDDVEDGDLTHINEDEMRPDVKYIVLRYKWSIGVGYVEVNDDEK